MNTHDIEGEGGMSMDKKLTSAVYAAVEKAYDHRCDIEDAADEILEIIKAYCKRRGEPVAWRWSESNGERWFDWTTDWSHHDRAVKMGYLIEYAAPLAPQPAKPDEWKLAVDHELTNMQSTADSYPSAKEAVKALIDWHVAVATDHVLQQPSEPVEGTPIQERIAKLERDPKKKVALDRARERLEAGEIRAEIEPLYLTASHPAEPVKRPLPPLHNMSIAELRELAMRDCSEYSSDDLAIAWELFDRLVEGGRIVEADRQR